MVHPATSRVPVATVPGHAARMRNRRRGKHAPLLRWDACPGWTNGQVENWSFRIVFDRRAAITLESRTDAPSVHERRNHCVNDSEGSRSP